MSLVESLQRVTHDLTGSRAFATPVEEICESLGEFGLPAPL